MVSRRIRVTTKWWPDLILSQNQGKISHLTPKSGTWSNLNWSREKRRILSQLGCGFSHGGDSLLELLMFTTFNHPGLLAQFSAFLLSSLSSNWYGKGLGSWRCELAVVTVDVACSRVYVRLENLGRQLRSNNRHGGDKWRLRLKWQSHTFVNPQEVDGFSQVWYYSLCWIPWWRLYFHLPLEHFSTRLSTEMLNHFLMCYWCTRQF